MTGWLANQSTNQSMHHRYEKGQLGASTYDGGSSVATPPPRDIHGGGEVVVPYDLPVRNTRETISVTGLDDDELIRNEETGEVFNRYSKEAARVRASVRASVRACVRVSVRRRGRARGRRGVCVLIDE